MPNITEFSDEELVAKTLLNKDSFLYLMERYEKKLLYYIIRISNVPKEDAEDILQDVFIKTYTNLRGFNHDKSFSSWIYRIAHNETISQFRKKKARPQQSIDEDDLTKIVAHCDIEKEVDRSIQKKQIYKNLEHLDQKYKEVLILKYIEEKQYEEIAVILNKPINTIGTLLSRAKKKFKQAYEK